ncbi:hypothetical protein ACGF3C_00750 [Micromonospora sp. NPDC047762]|uniref:hypothetical protein n=1 Tax=Micromonospora sp. NPDC047762 TaxID=3364255 RepID=UPI0037164EF1
MTISPDANPEDHPRNGFTVVRMVSVLGERLPIPSGTVFDLRHPLTEMRHGAIIGSISAGAADDELVLHEHWRSGSFYARLIDVAVRHEDDTIHYDARESGSADGSDSTMAQVAEALVASHATLGCKDCQNNAVERSGRALDSFLDTLEQAYTYATMRPVNVKRRPMPSADRWFDVIEYNASTNDRTSEAESFVTDSITPLEPVTLEEPMVERFSTAMWAVARHRELALYVDFVADSIRTLQFHDQASGSLILSAQASEALLDLTLQHMLWWDGMSAEHAAELFKGGIVARVKHIPNYGDRLGGSWDGSTGPVHDWKVNIADPRNRVAHGGRHASRQEGELAIEAARGLYDFICELANREKARRFYPALSALLVAGNQEKLSTKRQRDAADQYYHAEAGEHHERFQRWRSVLNRERSRINGNPLTPSTSFAECVAFFESGVIKSWWLLDPESFSVIQVEPFGADADVQGVVNNYVRRSGKNEGVIPLEIDKIPDLAPGAAWRDAMSLVGMETECGLASRFVR